MIHFAALHESAIGPKRTSLVAPHMSAFRGKADMPFCGAPDQTSTSVVRGIVPGCHILTWFKNL